MLRFCLFCSEVFDDKTKNGNRKICGKKACLCERDKVYRKNVNQDKRRLAIKSFKARNPNYLKDWRKKNYLFDKNYYASQYKGNLNFKFRAVLRARFFVALKKNFKNSSAVTDLGCSLDEFKMYLEYKFQTGMSWDNWSRRGWHIDHIKPLSSFDLSDPDQVKQACHYTNLQPLWAKDNLSKGNRNAVRKD